MLGRSPPGVRLLGLYQMPSLMPLSRVMRSQVRFDRAVEEIRQRSNA